MGSRLIRGRPARQAWNLLRDHGDDPLVQRVEDREGGPLHRDPVGFPGAITFADPRRLAGPAAALRLMKAAGLAVAAEGGPERVAVVVEEGADITLKPRPGEHGWERFDAYIMTERKYKYFVLDLEFKIAKEGNSGVFFRVGDPLEPVKQGIEVQILDTHGLENPGHHDCGGVIGTAAPSKNMAKPAGEWNRYIITCYGNSACLE